MRPNELATLILEQTTVNGKPLAANKRLTKEHHELVRQALNCLTTPEDALTLHRIYSSILKGTYEEEQEPYLQIEHLTHVDGFLCWRGVPVWPKVASKESEFEEALDCAKRCRALEHAGFTVNARTVTQAECYEAHRNTPWKKALETYCFFVRRKSHVAAVFHREIGAPGGSRVVGVEQDDDGHLTVKFFQTPAQAHHHYVYGEGQVVPADELGSSAAVEDLLAGTHLSPEEIDRILCM